jgi:hypothetical protein
MSYDIRLVKLVSGEMVVGNFAGSDIEEPAILQAMPTQQGTQMVLLPYGYPFDQEMKGKIDKSHVLFEYESCPEELKTKYIEAKTNISLSSGGLDLSGMGGAGSAGGGLDLG